MPEAGGPDRRGARRLFGCRRRRQDLQAGFPMILVVAEDERAALRYLSGKIVLAEGGPEGGAGGWTAEDLGRHEGPEDSGSVFIDGHPVDVQCCILDRPVS